MKRLRMRLVALLFLIVLCSSILAAQFSLLLRPFFPDEPGKIPVGMVFRELLVPVFSVLIATLIIGVASRRVVAPIIELSNAAKRIASGDFDVCVQSARQDELGALAENFNRMARELQNNEYLHQDFVANVSHEFRTPLSIIDGYAGLLAEGGLGKEECREYAATISRESRRLNRLVGNILKLSKLNHQEILLSPKPFRLDEQIRQSILLLEPKWSGKNLSLSLALSPVVYLGDEELLSQVWQNLLDNAIKFSREGGAVEVAMKKKETSLEISIRDQGIGMEERVRAHIFEQFYQGESSHAKEGTGLGLPIVQRVAALHGGSICVASTPGQGSVFTLSLPWRPDAG